MRILTKKEFLAEKTSDTIVVYGCGSSINQLTDPEKGALSKFDSVGFNWFLKSKIPTTFYLVREQANRPARILPGETREDLFFALSTRPYDKSCLIILKFKQKDSFPYHENLDKFPGKGIVTNDRKKKGVGDFPRFDLYDDACIHWKCTMTNVLHLAWHLKYKRILFVGVDLYDSRYFWIREGKTRATVKRKKNTYKSRHAVTKTTISAVRTFRKHYPKIEMFTYNPNSVLKKSMPIWER